MQHFYDQTPISSNLNHFIGFNRSFSENRNKIISIVIKIFFSMKNEYLSKNTNPLDDQMVHLLKLASNLMPKGQVQQQLQVEVKWLPAGQPTQLCPFQKGTLAGQASQFLVAGFS